MLIPALDPNVGGVQMSTWKLGTFFRHSGHEVGVFSFAEDGHAPQAFAPLFAAPEGGNVASQANLRALGAAIDAFRPDVVINQMPYDHAIGTVLTRYKDYLLLGCLRNTLYSVRANLDAYGKGILPRWAQPLFRNPIGRASLLQLHYVRHRRDLKRILATYDRFVMFGPPNLEELGYFVPGFDREKIALIPNSIPFVPKTVPVKEKRLLWLGRVIEAQKRAELILEVWKRVSAALPDWHLDIVGDGSALANIRKAVADEAIPRVEIHGRQVPDDYYRRAAIFFMTSSFEGFPNTLVEAQSFGAIPVVFDSYPIARWIVESGRNGFLIPPFDVDAMARKIVEIARTPERDRLAEQTLDSVRRFEIGQVYGLWQDLFEAEVPRQRNVAKGVSV